jgi:hypothetical protein
MGDLYMSAKQVPSVLDGSAVGVDPVSITIDALDLSHVQQVAADASAAINTLQEALAAQKAIKINP